MRKRERNRLLRMAGHFRGPSAIDCIAFFDAPGAIGDWLRWDDEICSYEVAARICESLAYDGKPGGKWK